MGRSKEPLVAAILLILVGVGSLFNTMNLIPQVDWLWTLGLAVVGILILAFRGINKVSFVLGFQLVLASVFSVFRQTGRLHIDYEVPCLLITLGVLILISYLAPLPAPKWLDDSVSRKIG